MPGLHADLGRAERDRVVHAADEVLAVVLVGVRRAAPDAEAAERAADDADVGDVDVAVDDERHDVAGELVAQLVGRLAHVLDHLGPALGEHRLELIRTERLPVAGALDRARRGGRRAAPRDERPVAVADHLEHARRDPLLVDELRVDAQALGQRDAVVGEPLAHLLRRRERVLGRDVVAVGRQPAEVGRAGLHQLRPPVGEVRRHLDADVGHQPPRLGDQPLHVVDGHRTRPLRGAEHRRVVQPRRPEALGRVGRDLGRLLAVVAPVRDEVLQDDLLEVIEARERLQRSHAVLLGLADADEDPAGERDPQLAGGPDRLEAALGVLGRRALVGDQVGVDGLEHQPLRRGDLAQVGEIGAVEHAEVRVREQPALECPLARPHHVGREVVEAELGELGLHPGVVIGRLAGEHQQLLDVAARRAVDQPLDLVGLVEVRLVGRERAVLAVTAARARERQRQVARERDPAAHAALDNTRGRHHVGP